MTTPEKDGKAEEKKEPPNKGWLTQDKVSRRIDRQLGDARDGN